jgi:SAM-dependent methyltransferase
MELDPYQHDNEANWSDRARVHAESDLYGLGRYENDPNFVNDVVAFDAPLLGDITGLSAVHLQCHIGTDTISLARLGAGDTAGLDFSETAIEIARRLSTDSGTPVDFRVGNVYDAPAVLGRTFDIVYTGVGAINWVGDLNRWGAAVAGCLKPGGRFYIRDMHPMAFVFEEVDGKILPTYNYFTSGDDPLSWDTNETYTDGDHTQIQHTKHHEWNHSLAEVVNALVDNGMEITRMVEHKGIEWQFVPSAVAEGSLWFLPPEQRNMMPLMFSAWATKKRT